MKEYWNKIYVNDRGWVLLPEKERHTKKDLYVIKDVNESIVSVYSDLDSAIYKMNNPDKLDVFYIEPGISLNRAEELTGEKYPTAYAIRSSFDKMTLEEKNIVIENVKYEVKEYEDQIKLNLKLRKEAYASDKCIYTARIKEDKYYLKRKQETFERLCKDL
jgi:hypothetical protein